MGFDDEYRMPWEKPDKGLNADLGARLRNWTEREYPCPYCGVATFKWHESPSTRVGEEVSLKRVTRGTLLVPRPLRLQSKCPRCEKRVRVAFRHQLAALIPFSLALITMVFVLEYSQWFVDQGYRRRSALGLVAIAWLIGAVLATPLVKRSLRVLPWSSESP